ncbi:uncharacterized protein LOC123547071 isoform X2 [Mercenaria mercenaria]|uniref:uncharacterized protein LOC123547071 isoform X2 n=1 Tax=Mercenaria mercenaria TaxID=6596 RepID=UPI00234EEB2D|nr:uncharacterized protein LOC123547071 isoform X2 [Mercenaria mercenaria]
MSDEPEETEYYLRLLSMYLDLGTETVLDVFEYHSPGGNPKTFLKSKEETIIKLKTKRILNKQESYLLLQEVNAEDKQKVNYVLRSLLDLKRFDISLLITLSINLFTEQLLPPPAKGWDQPPKNSDKSIAADLLRLRTTRNVIVGHHPRARLPKWRFDEEWEKVSEILIRIQQQLPLNKEARMKERVEAYRFQRLDPTVKNMNDAKIREWHEDVSKVQAQVEDLIKKIEGFDAYFEKKCDRYEKYIALLVRGGGFVLSALLGKEIKKQGRDLRSILDDSKDTLEGIITDSRQLEVLYPSTLDSKQSDPSTWDVPLLETVTLQLFGNSIEPVARDAIETLGDACRNYADTAFIALDGNRFEDYSTDLKASIRIISNYIDKEQSNKCKQILDECKENLSNGSFKTYMDELKTQSFLLKSFTDISKETLQQTKDCLQEMITNGISFKKSHELELKMITLGNDYQKTELAEEILTIVWHEALDRSNEATEFPEVKKEVLKILEEIKKGKNIESISIKKACIIMQISCTSPSDMLAVINYFGSDELYEALRNIAQELGYYFNTAFTVFSVIPIDSLWGISNRQSDPAQTEEFGIRLPISVTSPADMLQLRSLISSEKIINSTNSIADALSKHLAGKITVKAETDMKELKNVLDAEMTNSDSSSSNSSSINCSSSSNRQHYRSDTDCKADLSQLDKCVTSQECREQISREDIYEDLNKQHMPDGNYEVRYKPKTEVQSETAYSKIEAAHTGLSTEIEVGYKPKANVQKETSYSMIAAANTEIEVMRHLPCRLQEHSYNINDYSVTSEINKLVKEAQGVAHCVANTFSVRVNDVLQQKYKLSRVNCPGRVDIDNLSRSLLEFKEGVNDCFGQALAMKTNINNFIEITRGKKKCKETEIELAKIEISGLDKQIRLTEQDITKYEEDAREEERGAEELENRATDLRHESRRHRENGLGWGFLSFGVGLLFAPFTGGLSVFPSLASAGIGMKINFDSADDCDCTARSLRISAEDKRTKADRQRKLMKEYESKRDAKYSEIRDRNTMIDNLSKTCNGLIELERRLHLSVSGFERVIRIVQDFQNAIDLTWLQGDSFDLLKEVFIDCPEEFHDEAFGDEAHKGLQELKEKWKQLEQLFLSYSDHRGVAF